MTNIKKLSITGIIIILFSLDAYCAFAAQVAPIISAETSACPKLSNNNKVTKIKDNLVLTWNYAQKFTVPIVNPFPVTLIFTSTSFPYYQKAQSGWNIFLNCDQTLSQPDSENEFPSAHEFCHIVTADWNEQLVDICSFYGSGRPSLQITTDFDNKIKANFEEIKKIDPSKVRTTYCEKLNPWDGKSRTYLSGGCIRFWDFRDFQ